MKAKKDTKKLEDAKRVGHVSSKEGISEEQLSKNNGESKEDIKPKQENEIEGSQDIVEAKVKDESNLLSYGLNTNDFIVINDHDTLLKWGVPDYQSRIKYTFDSEDLGKYNRYFGDSTLENQFQLAEEINNLKKRLKKSAEELKDTQADREKKIKEFERLTAELIAKEKTNHILSRISEDGRKKLLESDAFHNLFSNSNKCDAVVVSIDIRRSTELMLKARTPELFSKFITELSFKLSKVIMANFGIFDKFTGDGILAFFPKFYSGEKAVIRAIKASNECHKIFEEHYNNSKTCFNVFIKDVGLGIGIDYGNVTLVNSQSELTVVGVPVVYACRFSGAKAGETLINQPAKEEILKVCPTLVSFHESEINIKNEGVALGYNVLLNEAAYDLEKPNWDELIETYKVQ